MMNTVTQDCISATMVSENRRLSILPKYAGHASMALEGAILDAMREYCADYQGGYWYMYELSNRAFYMAPGRDERLFLRGPHNYYNGTMSADAAGLVACLIGVNRLVWKTRSPHFADLFYAIRAYAAEHEEAGEIFAAID